MKKMHDMAVLVTYLTVIGIGLRWNTLPADVAFLQSMILSGAKFSALVLKNMCKKQWNSFTDNTPTYPRPPRTVFEQVPEPEQNDASVSDEESVHEAEEEEEEETKNSEVDENGDISSSEDKTE
jgi:hypothetical protein